MSIRLRCDSCQVPSLAGRRHKSSNIAGCSCSARCTSFFLRSLLRIARGIACGGNACVAGKMLCILVLPIVAAASWGCFVWLYLAMLHAVSEFDGSCAEGSRRVQLFS